jgi:hypothetical protein
MVDVNAFETAVGRFDSPEKNTSKMISNLSQDFIEEVSQLSPRAKI